MHVIRVVAHAHLYVATCAGCTYPGPPYGCVMLCTHSSQIHIYSYLQKDMARCSTPNLIYTRGVMSVQTEAHTECKLVIKV